MATYPYENTINDGVMSSILGGNFSVGNDLTVHGDTNLKGSVLNNSVKMSVIASGNYTGNNTVNRAIAHGLQVKPSIVLIIRCVVGSYNVIVKDDVFTFANYVSQSALAVTAKDDTNFYVGNATDYGMSGNLAANDFYWVAFV